MYTMQSFMCPVSTLCALVGCGVCTTGRILYHHQQQQKQANCSSSSSIMTVGPEQAAHLS
jgi:hypothetical protein